MTRHVSTRSGPARPVRCQKLSDPARKVVCRAYFLHSGRAGGRGWRTLLARRTVREGSRGSGARRSQPSPPFLPLDTSVHRNLRCSEYWRAQHKAALSIAKHPEGVAGRMLSDGKFAIVQFVILDKHAALVFQSYHPPLKR